MAYHAVLIAYHHNGGKAESAATLGYLRYPLYAYQPVLQFQAARFYDFHILIFPVHILKF